MNVATINLKLFFPPDNSFFQVHSHFSRIFNKIIKLQFFSRTGKTVVIFPGAMGTLMTVHKMVIFLNMAQLHYNFFING